MDRVVRALSIDFKEHRDVVRVDNANYWIDQVELRKHYLTQN